MAQPMCSRIFQQLEAQRSELLAELTLWSPDRLAFRPAPNAWSAVQVLDHIVRCETGTVADIRAGLKHPHPLGPEERPHIAMLDRSLRSDRAFQVPAEAPEIHPGARTTLPGVAERWQQARTGLAALLQPLTPADLEFGVFHHPFAGWMTLPDVLDHLSAHLYHHGFQIARLRESSAALG